MKRIAAIVGIVLLVASAGEALGHDTGFGHSRRTILFGATAKEIQVEYRVAVYADEALIELALMDQDGDGRVSAEERDLYFAARARQLAAAWDIRTADGQRMEPEFLRCELGPSLTQSYRFRIATTARALSFTDGAFSHKPGQISVLSGPGLKAEPQGPADLFHAERITIALTRTGP